MERQPRKRVQDCYFLLGLYITLIDEAIGELFDYLKEKNLYDNVTIVFTADHGDAMGAHRMIEKGEFMFENTYNIPMIIKDPESNRKGVEDDSLVYLHDLTSTVYDFAGQPIPEHFEGTSLLPIVRYGIPGNRTGVLGQMTGHFVYFEQRMWRKKDFKLVFNASDIGELYDIKNDPHEMVNLFDNPNYKDIKNQMLKGAHERIM